MPGKVILLIGKSGCGKSTAAGILKQYGFVERAFADPLKKFAESIGFTHDQLHGTQEQRLQINRFWNISAREFMQKFGSEVCRDTLPKIIPAMEMRNHTIWARVMEQHISRFPLLVISDGRFPDEAQLVKDSGGTLVRIVRDSPRVQTDYTCHKSEVLNQTITADFTIENNGSIDDLETALLSVLKSMGLKLEKIKKPCTGWSDVSYLATAIMCAVWYGVFCR